MWKKWVYIFTLFCLANNLFCFCAGASLYSHSQASVADIDSHAGGNSLLDLLIGTLQDDNDDDNGKTPFKSLAKHTWSIVREFALNVPVPMPAAYGLVHPQGIVRHVYGNHLICKATLPTYYNFLFRLSPF